MRRMSMSEVTTYSWSFDEDVSNYSRLGYDAIGVWRPKLMDFGIERGIQMIREAPLNVSSLTWIGGFTFSDGVPHEASIQDGLHAIRLAYDLQANCLITYTGGRGGHTSNHARRLVCHALDRLLPLAEELNINLALEPMHPRCAGEWTILTNLDEALWLIHEMGSERLKLVWDTYQLGGRADYLQRIEELVEHVALVQLSDARAPHCPEQNRCLLGRGRLGWERTYRSFQQAGYAGFWEIELLGEDLEAISYDQLLERSIASVTELVPSHLSQVQVRGLPT